MSDTPRTDAFEALTERPINWWDFARELERENAALRAEVNVTRKNYQNYQTENAALRSAVDQQANYQRDLRADRDRLDWLARHRSLKRGYFDRSSQSWYVMRVPSGYDYNKGGRDLDLRAAIDAELEKEAQP